MALTYSLPVSAATIISRVRDLGEFRSTRLSDAILLAYINQSISALHSFLVATDPSLSVQAATLTTIANGSPAAYLPTDCARILSVSSSDQDKLERIDIRFMDTTVSTLTTDEEPYYSIAGSGLYLTPPHSVSSSLSLMYTRCAPVLSSVNDTWDGLGVQGWVDVIVYGVLFLCSIREGEDGAAWQALKNEALGVCLSNSRRDQARPRTRTLAADTEAPTFRKWYEK